MAEILEARVIQKIATETEWLSYDFTPYKGEIMLVGDSAGKVYNLKVGDGVNEFADLNYAFDSIQQNVGYIAITSNALPTPSDEVAWGIVTAGSYTFGGNPAFTVPAGHWGIANYSSGAWSFVDMGELPVAPAEGEVLPGDNRPISGNKVFDYLDNVIVTDSSDQELSFNLVPGQVSPDGTTGSSLNWISTDPIPVGDDSLIEIQGYGNGSATVLKTDRVICLDVTNTALGSIDSTGVTNNFTFNPLPGTVNIKINVQAGTNVGADIPNSPYWDSFKVIEKGVTSPKLRAEEIIGTIETPQIQGIESEISILDSKMEDLEVFVYDEYVDKFTGTTVQGALGSSGSLNNVSDYRRTVNNNISGMVPTNDDESSFYTGVINGTYVAVQFFSENLTYLGFDLQGTGSPTTYTRELLNKPEGTRYMAMCAYQTEPIIESSVKKLRAGNITVYVDVAYDGGSSDGSETRPFKSINDAINTFYGYDIRVIVSDGIYKETVNLDVASNVSIQGKGSGCIISGAEDITGWSKTTGYTNVYQTEYNPNIPSPTFGPRRIFENGNPSIPILKEDYQPQYRGLSHKLPYTEIKEVGSIELVDSTQGSFFKDGDTLYIHTGDSSNPSTNSFTYENSVRPTTTETGNINYCKVDLLNVTFMFSSRKGVRCVGKRVFRNNVTVYGSAQEGFKDDRCFGSAYNDISAGCGNDGCNGHYADDPATIPAPINLITEAYNMTYVNGWYFNCGGDGISHHNRSNILIYNCLSENNGRRGFIPFAGSATTIVNSISRNNAMEGVSASGVSTDGRVRTSINTYGCLIYGNSKNVDAANGSVINSKNTLTWGASVSEWSATSNGLITAYNCGAENADPSKIKVTTGGGVINVLNIPDLL